MKTKQKISLLLVALFTVGMAFGQMKYKPEVVVVILGDKNPTFDESKFPDLQFYYTPDMKLKVSKKAAANNTSKHAWSSALGVGRTAHAEAHDSYYGKPDVLVENRISSGYTYILDKNGVINGKIFSGKQAEFNSQNKFLVKFNKMQRKWESETLGDLMKTLVKKGEVYEAPKKKKKKNSKPPKLFTVGQSVGTFQVVDKDGNRKEIQSLVKGNPATLLLFLYLNPVYDFNKGKESGAGKKGKDYMNQVAQTAAADKQVAPLYRLERQIYGKRIER